jgi:hypothetical protein
MATAGGETFQLIRGGTTIDISDMMSYSVVEFDGLGMPPTRRLVQRGPLQNGDTDVGYRLDARIVRLVLWAFASTPQSMHARRDQLLGMMRPGVSSDTIKLLWTYTNITGATKQRQIDLHYLNAMSLPSKDLVRFNGRVAVELRAADPTWYDPVGQTVQFAQTGGGTPFPVPVLIPMTFGASTLSGTTAIPLLDVNAVDVYPTIIIAGPITGPVITNVTTGDKLDFTGYSIGNGITYTIDTRYGYKTVIDSGGVSRISQLTTDSSLATFRLVPGTNSIGAYGTSITGSTSITVQYNPRFIGT